MTTQDDAALVSSAHRKQREPPSIGPSSGPAISPWSTLWPAAALLAITVLAYWPAFDDGFVAEDFNLIAYFSRTPWARIVAQFSGPLFANEIGVDYYRPIATSFVGIECILFGMNALPYWIMHVLIHFLNALMIYAIVTQLVDDRRRRVAFAAAVLFAVHPLGHVAVLIAYYATLCCTTFVLLAFLTHLHFRRTGLARYRVASLVAFALALGSYELAPVFLVLLAAYEALVSRERAPLRRIVRASIGYVVLLAAYVAVRTSTLGEPAGASFFLANFRLATALWNLPVAVLKMLHPTFGGFFDSGAPLALFWGAALLLVGMLARSLVDAPGRWRVCAFAVCWTVVASAPFVTFAIDLSVAKYWYLASVGTCLAIALVVVPANRSSRTRTVLGYGALLGLVSYYAVINHHYLGMLGEMADADRAMHRRLSSGRLEDSAPDGRCTAVFVTGAPCYRPSFFHNYRLPKVTSIGLNAALSPPFADTGFTAYLVPDEQAGTVRRLIAGDPTYAVLSLTGSEARSPNEAPPPERPLPALDVEALAVALDRTKKIHPVKIAFRAHGQRRLDVCVISELPFLLREAANDADGDGTWSLEIALNRLMVVPRNGRSRVFWWVEALDDHGRPVARSALQSFRPPLIP